MAAEAIYNFDQQDDDKQANVSGGSPGLEVIGGDSCP